MAAAIHGRDASAAVGGRSRIGSVSSEPSRLLVRWVDGSASGFPWIWLRDNCGCPQCRHPGNGQRLIDVLDLPDRPETESVRLASDGAVEIRWRPDGHASRYRGEWLKAHDLAPEARRARRPRLRLWGAEIMRDPPVVSWPELESSPEAERAALERLVQDGFLLLRDVPIESGMVVRVGDRIGHVRVTNYGRHFDVVSVPNPNNLAYTAVALGVHTDNPYRDPPPGLQLLHCLEAGAPGGNSVLVDGFAAAEDLRRDDPEAFDLLSRLPLAFRFADGTADLRASTPVIETDFEGRVRGIHFNNRSMAPLDLPEAVVEPWYAAYRAFARLLRRPGKEARLRLAPGDLLVMQNQRVLHGRESYDANAGRRHLQGCYVDSDGVESRLRMLSRDATAERGSRA